jgi:hypothetical protein
MKIPDDDAKIINEIIRKNRKTSAGRKQASQNSIKKIIGDKIWKALRGSKH